MVVMNRSAPQEMKHPSIRKAYRDSPKKLLKEVFLKIAKRLSVYYPDHADYYTGPDFMLLFASEVQEQFPNLMPEEVFHAIARGLRSNKQYGWPKLNDFMLMIKEYSETRAAWIEDYEKNKIVNLNTIHPSVLKVFKAAIAEVQEEEKAKEAERQKERDKALREEQKRIKKRDKAKNHGKDQ
jgi:hypothetical protein